MKIAIEGCAHGQLEKIYDVLTEIEKREFFKIDLLICCGDFQSTRNMEDLQTMSIPLKYQDICTFYKYYSGEKQAPILTVFIGGNHEASNYLQELPYGGWVAPNIYYLGYAGIIQVNGIRIGGISGIFKRHDYYRGHFELSPYSESTKRSVYHIRQLEVFRLKQISGDIDIFISHDWPRGIYHYGNHKQLLRFKPHFKDEIENDRLGSPPCQDLLDCLKPSYWFAAHLHCQFVAFVPHADSTKTTKFLALDKCLPKRRFLQLLQIDNANTKTDACIKLEYDLEWLTILFLTNHLISAKRTINYMPGPNGQGRYDFTPTDKEKSLILDKFDYDLNIPLNFYRTVEPYNADLSEDIYSQPRSQINPQTANFCSKLSIDDPLVIVKILNGEQVHEFSQLDKSMKTNNLYEVCELKNEPGCSKSTTLVKKINPEEIDISEENSRDLEDFMNEELKLETELLKTTNTLNKAIEKLNSEQIIPEDSEVLKDIVDSKPKLELNNPNLLNASFKPLKRRNECVYSEKD